MDSSGHLFIADTGNNVIREVVLSTGTISLIAGSSTGASGYSGDGGLASAALFFNPEGLFATSSGGLYVADSFNSAIREINLDTGIISADCG